MESSNTKTNPSGHSLKFRLFIGLIAILLIAAALHSFSFTAQVVKPSSKAKAFSEVSIPRAYNFEKDANTQKKNQQVILLYVSAEHCPFCMKLEKEIIKPMIRSGDYKNKAMLRKILWDDDFSIIDFDGNFVKPKIFLKRYGVKITPTLLFLDGEGHQLSELIMGYRGDDFFWFYLDKAINKANAKLKNNS